MPIIAITKRICLMAALCTCLVLPGAASAATYWVSPEGQASWAVCQTSTPLNGTAACSIGSANKYAMAGDTVYLRGGTYTGDNFINPSNSGESGSPVTFAAYNDEKVIVNTQRVPNGKHESAAWAAWNGANVEQSSDKIWEGNYSTKFIASQQGQGIISNVFTLPRERSGLGYWYTFRVYSDQISVNVKVRNADSSAVPLDLNRTLVPNQWNVFSGYMLTSSPDQFYVVVSSNADAPLGTWYVDDVRMNVYMPSIYLNGKSHIVVQGVHIGEVLRGFELQNGADYNEISHCSFTDMNIYSTNIIWDGNGSPSRYNWIHNSIFYKSGYVVRGAGGPTVADDIQTLLRIGNDTSTDSSGFNLIENNYFYHGGHDIAIIATKFNTFRNNRLHNEGWMLNHEGPSASAAGGYNNPNYFGNRCLLIENPGNNGGYNLVEGNRIGYSGTPPDDDGASGIENPADGNIVRYNFLFKNGASGFYFKAQPGITNVDVMPDNNVVYNNTIYKNGGGYDISESFQSGIHLNCYPNNPTGNVIINNIVYDNTVAVRWGKCGEGYLYVNNFEQDPLFVNPELSDPFSATLPNLALQRGSPAIDQAAALTTVKTGDAGTGTTVAVVDARFFQDGSWGPPGKVAPDVIAIGQTGNTAQIVSIDYAKNLIVLAMPLQRQAGDSVWLYKKSDGARVLFGKGPDFGASEFETETISPPQGRPDVVR